MKTIKVSEATGPALDWLVATCEDYEIRPVMRGMKTGVRNYEHEPWWVFTPSTNWYSGGTIITRERLQVSPTWKAPDEGWTALVYDRLFEDDGTECHQCGPTLLIAAMRCYVASKLGETAEVPEELVCPNT